MSLWLFLLLHQLCFSLADADQNLPNSAPDSGHGDGGSSSHTPGPGLSDGRLDTDANGTRVDCLIDTEMGLIALGSAGGLIVCLVVTIVVLSYQIFHIERRARNLRASRSSLNLTRGSNRAELQGLVGPCDASVMLEEVRADGRLEEDEEDGKGKESEEDGAEPEEDGAEPEEGGAEPEESAVLMAVEPVEAFEVATSSSRDSLVQRLEDVENLPLVV